MSLQRVEYLKDLMQDARTASNDPQIISAIILSDALNGVRKGLLDISNGLRNQTGNAFTASEVRGKVNHFLTCLERLSHSSQVLGEDSK